MEKEKLTKLANEFIEECNVFGLVYAKEGGTIKLESLLVDFVKYIESEEDK